jgi:hypothetical protein
MIALEAELAKAALTAAAGRLGMPMARRNLQKYGPTGMEDPAAAEVKDKVVFQSMPGWFDGSHHRRRRLGSQ